MGIVRIERELSDLAANLVHGENLFDIRSRNLVNILDARGGPPTVEEMDERQSRVDGGDVRGQTEVDDFLNVG